MPIEAITPEQETLLCSDNQRTELFLGFTDPPPVVFTCVINQTFSTHDMVFEFLYNTPTGDLADVLPGMTAWIGSDVGLYDIGQCRIRKAPVSGTLYVSEGSEIDWANALYVTIVDEMGLWPKHLFIDTDETVYVDRDIAYTDQYEKFAPVPIMGCNAILDVESYPATVRFPEVDRSWVFDSTITGYLWTATEGTFDNNAIANPVLTIVAYPANGLIRVALRLTTAAGAQFTGYRYVQVYDAEQDAYGLSMHRPIQVFQLASCRGDYRTGGFSFEVTLYSESGRDEIRDRAPIYLFARDYYGNSVTSIGQLAGRENIVAMGWIDAESIEYDPSGGTVTFTVQGPQFWMERMNGYPSTVRMATNTPDRWITMPALTVDRGLWYFLHNHTTATAVLDVTLTGDTRYAAEMRSPNSSLWAQIVEMASTSIFATGGFDPYGRLFISIDPQMTPAAGRTWAVVQEIEPVDFENKIQIDRITVSDVSILYFSGVAVSAGGQGKAYFSLSPGHVHKRYGAPFQIERILLSDQAQSNELCGLLMGWKNNEYPLIGVAFAQNNHMFTLFPPQFGHITIAEGDTERGVTLDKNLVPRSINFAWDGDAGVLSTEINFEAETFPELSTNGDVPGIIEAEDITDPPDIDLDFPPFDIVVSPDPTIENTNLPRVVVNGSRNYGIHYTEDFNTDDVAGPEWISMNDGLTDTIYAGLQNLVVTPDGTLFMQTSFKVFAADGIGGTWVEIADIADFNSGAITGIAVDPNESGQIVITGSLHVNGAPMGRFVFATIDGLGAGAGVNVMRMHTNQQGIAYTNNKWTVIGNADAVFLDATYWAFDGGGTLQNGELGTFCVGAPGAAPAVYIVPVGTQDIIFYWTASGTPGSWKVTLDGTGFATFVALTTIGPNTIQGISPSPTGTILMAGSWYGVGAYHVPYKSTDSGATWSSLAGTIPVGPDVWENCRDDNRWIFGGGTVIRFTADVGTTYIDRMGNLPYIAPLIDITLIRFIE